MVQISVHLSQKQLAFIDKAVNGYQSSRNSFITYACIKHAEERLGTKIGDVENASEPQ